MEYKEKIQAVMEHVSMNASMFAAEIDINASALSHILNGRNNASIDVITKILHRFPDINADWLVLDKGPMLRQISNSKEPSLFNNDEVNNYAADRYPEKNDTKNINLQAQINVPKEQPQPIIQIVEKEVPVTKHITKIIAYFSDNSFQEFEGKKQ